MKKHEPVNFNGIQFGMSRGIEFILDKPLAHFWSEIGIMENNLDCGLKRSVEISMEEFNEEA